MLVHLKPVYIFGAHYRELYWLRKDRCKCNLGVNRTDLRGLKPRHLRPRSRQLAICRLCLCMGNVCYLHWPIDRNQTKLTWTDFIDWHARVGAVTKAARSTAPTTARGVTCDAVLTTTSHECAVVVGEVSGKSDVYACRLESQADLPHLSRWYHTPRQCVVDHQGAGQFSVEIAL